MLSYGFTLLVDVYSQIMLTDVKRNHRDSLIAQKAVFGWVLTGRISQPHYLNSIVSFFTHLDLKDQITRFWKVQEVPKFKKVTPEDKFCEDLYHRITTRNREECYVVTLPLKSEFPTS